MERRLQQLFFALSILALVLIVAAAWQANTPSGRPISTTSSVEAQGEPMP